MGDFVASLNGKVELDGGISMLVLLVKFHNVAA